MLNHQHRNLKKPLTPFRILRSKTTTTQAHTYPLAPAKTHSNNKTALFTLARVNYSAGKQSRRVLANLRAIA